MAANLIDSPAQIKELVTRIESSDPRFPFLFIDLEGVNLSRHGSIAIMQILVGPEKTVHLIDVYRLQRLVFETPSDSGLTLHQIFESNTYPKVFFDVRTDSDALNAHYNIKLRCVVDLQLMEFITRPVRGQFLAGLTKCIERDLSFTPQELLHMKRVKEAGRGHFSPERGGRYEVFNSRPLNSILIEYCIQDVQFMPRLLVRYAERLQRTQAIQVQTETALRIQQSQAAVAIRKGRHMAIGPMFAPVQTAIGQTINLAHPMNIICSPLISTYCEPPVTFDPFSNPNVTTSVRSTAVLHPLGHSRHASIPVPIQPAPESASNLEPRRLSHPILLNNQDRMFGTSHSLSSFTAMPMASTFITNDGIPAYTSTLPPITAPLTTTPVSASRAFFQPSPRKTPDFTLSEVQNHNEDNADDNDDLEMNTHYGSLSFLDEEEDDSNSSNFHATTRTPHRRM